MKPFRKPNWAVTLVLSALALAVVTIISTPLLLSSSAVRGGVSEHLSKATGLPVQLRGEPSVTLQPYLGVTYRDVVIGPAEQPVMVADEMKVRLQVWSALLGQPRVSEVQLVRPAFDLRKEEGRSGNWITPESPITHAISSNTQTGFDVPFLRMDLQDGALRYSNGGEKPDIELGNLNGSIKWPTLSARADIALKAVWNGENITLDATFEKPLALISGGSSAMTFAGRGALGALRFTGDITTADAGTGIEEASGRLSFTSPATQQLGRWLSQDDAVIWPATQLTGEGNFVLRGNTVQLNEAQLSIADQPSTGRLDISLATGEAPKISGTLAFTRLNLPTLIAEQDSLAHHMASLAKHSPITLDLRLSAPQAVAPEITINDVAAGLIVRERSVQLDLVQGELNGGQISGTIETSSSEDDTNTLAAELRLKAGELSALTPLFGQTALQLSGEGDVSIDAFSTSPSGKAPYSRITMDIRGGTLEGVSFSNLTSALVGTDEAGRNILDGSTNLDTLATTVFLRDGLLVLRDAKLESAETTLSLTGRSVIKRASLALRGTLTKGDEPPASFFVGGTFDQPLIVPFTAITGGN